jgi:tRNA modification GTPase
MQLHDDTITAVATPVGEGGISVIRVSGPAAIDVADKHFRGKMNLRDAATHTAHFGKYVGEDGCTVDEVVVTVFRKPHSYTAENVVEVSCHGGRYVTKVILESLLKSGARMALPGEFTRRAFLNGRIDLSQAEAVADLIQSRSEVLHRVSVYQLEGRLSGEIRSLREKLTLTCGLLELELDFSEEGIELQERSVLVKQVEEVLLRVRKLAETFREGQLYRDGVKVLIAGRPNVGKSSIFNTLLNENRAIVTDIPGTTRDILRESMCFGGVIFDLFDTAGLREAEDIIETEGIRRTQESSRSAHIILFVIDSCIGFTNDDMEALRKLSVLGGETGELIILINKIDLSPHIGENWNSFEGISPLRIVKVSARTGEGVSELRQALYDVSIGSVPRSQDASVTITRLRHNDALLHAASSLQLVVDGIAKGAANELLTPDLRDAMNHLGSIVGEITSEDILNGIFSEFCIGK